MEAKQVTIYKKESLRPLSEYQRRINETAQDICVKNPTMQQNRLMLLIAAQEEVNKSYKFKKGKSCSKRQAIQGTPSTRPKRKKMNKDFRLERMKTVEEDIKH